MKRLPKNIVLGILLLAHTTYARLGETESQLISRYGPILKTKEINGLPVHEFMANGFIFQFSMIDGVAESFSVRKINGLFTSQEVIQFLQRNKTGTGEWVQKEVDKKNYTISFVGPNGEHAEYDGKANVIVVVSRKLIQQATANKIRKKEEERKQEEIEAQKALEGL